MIVITGATGQLGSQTVAALLDRVPADQIAVSVRDPTGAAALSARGVRVRHGDFADPASLATAFEGATQVLVVSAGVRGEAAIAYNVTAIDAARAAGAQRVLYTSHQAAAGDSLFPPMLTHAATEHHLLDSGATFTSLRNGFYASTVPRLIGDALRTGQLTAPADGPVSWTTHADLAQATAAVLAEPGRVDGISPPLTAPDTVDLAGVATMLSELTGRQISRTVAADDQWRADAIAGGVPEFAADFALGQFRAARRGEFNTTDPLLEDLLGRPATPLRSVLAELVATM